MIRCLTLSAALLLTSIADVTAQRSPVVTKIPKVVLPAGMSQDRLQKSLQQMLHSVRGASEGMQKTTAGNERLAAEANYDLTQPPANQILDSMRFKYSAGRSSEFNYQELYQDFYNNADYPSPFPTAGYVHYDTIRQFTPPGSPSSAVIAVRSYNAAGKVVLDLNPATVTRFEYSSANKLVKITAAQYNSGTGSFDSSYRDFYLYDASGFLVKDSTESWNAGTNSFQPSGVLNYTNNSAGLPIQVSLDFNLGPVTLTILQFEILYPSSSTMPSRTILKFYDGTGLENDSKDTFGYAGTMLNYQNSYSWDTTSRAWMLNFEERRHLNASMLPDSVWTRSIDNGLPIDSTVSKLTYSAQGNPTKLVSYYSGSTTPEEETRWYYEPITVASVRGVAVNKDLVAYPNPSSDKLYLKGMTEGRYSVHNAMGQLLMTGDLQPAAGIPVQGLTPGMYSVTLQDKAGNMHVAQFIRK